MTTIASGINRQSTLSVTSSKMDYARNRWEIAYSILNENIEPRSTINTIERVAIIRNIPAQVDEEGVEIAPSDNQLDEFRDQIVSAGLLDEASEQAAINHAETIGVFVEYIDPTESAWESEVPTAPPIDETTPWEAGVFVARGMLRSFEDEVYRVVQSHTTQADWTPPQVPALFTLVPQAEGDDLLPWVQPTGAPDAYSIGDQRRHNGQCWESAVNGNVWEPGATGIGDNIWFAIDCP